MESFKNFMENKINWAIGKNIHHALLKPNYDNEILLKLDIEKVMKDVDPDTGLNIHSTNGGPNAKQYRIDNLYTHIENEGFLDPPEIGYNEHKRKIVFGNGRHRTFVAYKMGHKKIPFYVPKDQKDFFKDYK